MSGQELSPRREKGAKVAGGRFGGVNRNVGERPRWGRSQRV